MAKFAQKWQFLDRILLPGVAILGLESGSREKNKLEALRQHDFHVPRFAAICNKNKKTSKTK